MQDAAGGGGDIHLLLTILADGEEQARQLELGEPAGAAPATDGQSSYPGGHRRGEEYYRGVARQLQCTFTKAMAVARAIEAAAGAGAGAGASGSRGTTGAGSRSDSADESSGRTATDVLHQERQDVPKRRKGALPRWTENFRVADANLDATPDQDDGFSWRKYGQKDILGAKFPRGYYRCTYRNAQGCPATKQVQRSDTDLCVFDVTYQGVHTCHHKHRRGGNHHHPPPPPAPAPPQDLGTELLRNFNHGLKVETDDELLEPPTSAAAAALTFEQNGAYGAAGQFCFPSVPFHAGVMTTTPLPDDAFSPVKSGAQLGGGAFSPAFVSPAMSAAGSSYFSLQAHGYDYEHHQGGQFAIRGTGSSELDEVVSAATTAAVHPAAFDDPLYHDVELDPHLPLAPMFGPAASMHGHHYRNA
ncbi:hypothetical protein GUJ93_ZPchr0012g21986 [Zizania palustris]|uniref:WRKY domain-containing protein n=1 Tax=Zizania palustris TaxID=103762 RepID=A0A8J5WT33_ZIZPA|nr:hypothetical protein GUJ93_ZPchr0012g21986 [Zizania palustris]